MLEASRVGGAESIFGQGAGRKGSGLWGARWGLGVEWRGLGGALFDAMRRSPSPPHSPLATHPTSPCPCTLHSDPEFGRFCHYLSPHKTQQAFACIGRSSGGN